LTHQAVAQFIPQFIYKLITAGADPVTLDDMKSYLKDPPDADDALITSMIGAATEWGQKYTGREFTDNEWSLLLDCFDIRIEVRRSPVATIDKVEYLVSGSNVEVSADVYYLKFGNFTSEILLNEDKEWPTDGDDREQGITITFTTEQFRCGESIDTAIKQHVAFWYANRGDCNEAAELSGVKSIYDLFKIPRT